MRLISLLLASFIMLMCTAPAFEEDMCALRSQECQCEGTCGDGCDCGCDCCSPFIACATCTGFVTARQMDVATPVVYDRAVSVSQPVERIPEAFISVETPPPSYR